jgi:hypothetical protein
MDEFKNYYRIVEEKLANKDFSNNMEVVEKEKKKPKKRLNQIFFGVSPSMMKSSTKNVS